MCEKLAVDLAMELNVLKESGALIEGFQEGDHFIWLVSTQVNPDVINIYSYTLATPHYQMIQVPRSFIQSLSE